MMNTVTSTRMRKIWMDGQAAHDSGQTVGSAASVGAENSFLQGDLLSSRASGLGGGGEPFTENDDFFTRINDPNADYRARAAQQACESSSHLSANSCPRPVQTDTRHTDKGFHPMSDNPPFGRYPTLGHSQHASDTRRPLCSRHRLHADKELVHKNPNEDEDDISSLIDNARLELQIEEEEEEVKQNLQLLMRRQHRQDASAYDLGGADGLQPTTESCRGLPFRLDTEGSSSRNSIGFSASRPERDLTVGGKKGAMEHFRLNDSEPSPRQDTKVKSSPEEPERQVLFVLRKSTVNHHLSQDLQQDDVISSTSYPAFSQPPGNWRTTLQPSYSAAQANATNGYSARQDEGRCSFPADAGHGATACSPTRSPLTADNSDQGLNIPRGRDVEQDTRHSDSSTFNGGFLTSDGGPRVDSNYSLQCADETGFNGHCEKEPRSSVGTLGPGEPFNNSPSKIRILGSKSYSEAYATGEDACQREGCGDQALVSPGQSSRSKADGGGSRDSNRKPIVVSVRPLSHAARRGNHSYLTQRHSNRHRQCQNKAHSNRHRQVRHVSAFDFLLPLVACNCFAVVVAAIVFVVFAAAVSSSLPLLCRCCSCFVIVVVLAASLSFSLRQLFRHRPCYCRYCCSSLNFVCVAAAAVFVLKVIWYG